MAVTKVIHEGHEFCKCKDVEAILPRWTNPKFAPLKTPSFCSPHSSTCLEHAMKPRPPMKYLWKCPPHTSVCTQELLHHLKVCPTPTNAKHFLPHCMITAKDNTKAWSRAKERTSSGISGLHFRMFKAHSCCPKLLALNASLQSVAYTMGFSYSRKKKVLLSNSSKRNIIFKLTNSAWYYCWRPTSTWIIKPLAATSCALVNVIISFPCTTMEVAKVTVPQKSVWTLACGRGGQI